MAVDFYYLGDKGYKNRIFQLDDRDFGEMQNALVEYKRRTGLGIDQYSDTNIHADHVKLIVELLKLSYEKSSRANKKLLEIIEKFKNTDGDLVAVGE